MDEQTAIDRITEVENLTDNLEDDDANWLINWGIGKARALLPAIKDEDAAGEKLDALMAVMRKLNEIVPDLADKAPKAFANDVDELAKLYTEAFGAAKPLAANNPALTAKAIQQKSPREVMEHLLGLIMPVEGSGKKLVEENKKPKRK